MLSFATVGKSHACLISQFQESKFGKQVFDQQSFDKQAKDTNLIVQRTSGTLDLRLICLASRRLVDISKQVRVTLLPAIYR